MTNDSKRSGRGFGWCAAAAAALALAAGPARAAVGFTTDAGWGASFEGFINAFAVDSLGGSRPATGVADPLGPTTTSNTFRVRTGLLPGLFAFSLAAPAVEGLQVKARIGFYPQISNSGQREQFGAQIDLREAFFTVDGAFGQALAGRALNLYQAKNILTDLTLFGVGVQGAAIAAGGTTAGRIGYGYVYTSFGAQFRYTTPAWRGLTVAVALGDPNAIGAATEVRAPAVESELAWSGDLGRARVQAFASGLHQRAWLGGGRSVTAIGGAGGVGVSGGGAEVLASGFVGKGIGSFFMLEVDALDGVDEERTTGGFLVQGAYTLGGKTKVGASYGQNATRETSDDRADRQGGSLAQIDTRRSVTAGVYHDLRSSLRLVAEYTRAETRWFGGGTQATDVFAVGGFVFW